MKYNSIEMLMVVWHIPFIMGFLFIGNSTPTQVNDLDNGESQLSTG